VDGSDDSVSNDSGEIEVWIYWAGKRYAGGCKNFAQQLCALHM